MLGSIHWDLGTWVDKFLKVVHSIQNVCIKMHMGTLDSLLVLKRLVNF